MTTKKDDDFPEAKAQATPNAPTDGAGNKNLLDKDIPTAKDEPAMPAAMMADDKPVPKRDQVQILVAKDDVTTHPLVIGVNGVFHEIETGKPTTIDRHLLRNLDDMGIPYTLVK